MDKYINLEELTKFPIRQNHYDKEHGNEDFICGIETVLEYAENLPATDVALVRHGQWKCHGDCGVTECSACGWSIEEYVGDYAYCPNCGAKMDEVSE